MQISINDFFEVDIRKGNIIDAVLFKEAIKPAFKLWIDFGPKIGIKKSSAQITNLYNSEDLKGKSILAVINLPPRQIGPFISEVLVLGLNDENNSITINKSTAHNKPVLGFNLASELSSVGAWHSNDLDEFSGMKYEATLMGERITQLYLDPLSASIIRTGLRRAIRRIVKDIAPVTNFGLLHLATSTPDFTSLWAKNSEMEPNSKLWIKTNSVEDELLSDSSYDEMLLSNVKSAWMVEMWCDESNIRSIEKDLDVNPGDINYRVDIMAWLIHSSREIILTDDVFSDEHMAQIAELIKQLDVLRLRVRHGCKEDLLTLVNIPNVGRYRARELSKLDIRTPHDVANMTKKKREQILKIRGWGPHLLDKIMLEVAKVIEPSKQQKRKIRLDDIPLDDEI